MTKAELARAIATRNEMNHKEAVKVVDAILETVAAALAQGEKVELRGFGSFTIKKKYARSARNPKTGERIEVPPKTVALFKASKSFKRSLETGRLELPGPDDGVM